MPLTPQTQAVLEARKAAGMGDLATIGPEAAREQMKRMREAMNATPEPIAHVEDRTIPGPGGEIPMRIYRSSTGRTLPVLVFFHGGGWVIGDLDIARRPPAARSRTAPACCVVAVDYRLAPEHRYPAARRRCYAATKWVAEHAAELGVDASRLAVGGDSAGGNLAAVVALMARDRGGPPLASRSSSTRSPTSTTPPPPTARTANGDYGLTRGEHALVLGRIPPSAPSRAPSRTRRRCGRRASSGLPRALVMTAEYDPLRDEGEAYGRALEAAGIPTTVKRYAGVVHGFLGQAAAVPEGGQALDQIAEELKALAPVAAR